MRRRCRRVPALRSSFAGFRFPPDVITLAVRWYLRYGLSYRDVEELLAESRFAKSATAAGLALQIRDFISSAPLAADEAEGR